MRLIDRPGDESLVALEMTDLAFIDSVQQKSRCVQSA